VVIEIPKGSSNKYEYDPELKVFRLDRSIYSPMQYPGDYGFIPGTVAEDNDPLDILCLVTNPSYPGIVYYARPVGVLDMIDDGQPDRKIVAVPHRDPRFETVRSIEDVALHIRREIEHFFSIYKELQGQSTVMEGWRDIDAAVRVISESVTRHSERLGAQRPA
jgi:inorganic pyrophosphatase